MDWPVEGACAVAYAIWQDVYVTVEQAEAEFASVCVAAGMDL